MSRARTFLPFFVHIRKDDLIVDARPKRFTVRQPRIKIVHVCERAA